jgi:Glycosyl hydrolase family 3 C-terminal domain
LMDALVAAWLPGTEGQGIADVLFGDAPCTGKLPYTWPRWSKQLGVAKTILDLRKFYQHNHPFLINLGVKLFRRGIPV